MKAMSEAKIKPYGKKGIVFELKKGKTWKPEWVKDVMFIVEDMGFHLEWKVNGNKLIGTAKNRRQIQSLAIVLMKRING